MKGSCAAPGDRLVVAQDLQGKRYGRLHIWDTVTSAEGAHTRAMLEPLPAIAESGLCSACRDVSNAGLLGTVAMMMEASGTGAEVDLDSLAVPIGVGLQWWLKAYPSYGFILSVPPENLEAVTGMFEGAGATCSLIGEVTEGSSVMLSLSDETDIFLDWKSEPVTGLF
jgi:selenophosphate synthetase-related protein